MNPFMAFTNEEILTKRLVEEFTALALKKMKLRVLLTKHGMNLLLHVMT